MAFLSQELFREVVNLLEPFLARESDRLALLTSAFGLRHPILLRLDMSGSPTTFAVQLVSYLKDYGEVEPGQQALTVLLRSLREQVGSNRQQRIDALIAALDERSTLPERIEKTEGEEMRTAEPSPDFLDDVPVYPAKSPYVGPTEFTHNDADRFFGRSREITELSTLVIAYPLTLLYAKSGAGKSSLVKAGLIPELERQNFEVLPPVRVNRNPAENDRDRVANIFVYSVLSSLDEHGQASANTPSRLRQTLVDYLVQLPHHYDRYEMPLTRVLIFDQFEEVFTTHPDRWRDQRGLFEQVNAALERDPYLRVVFSMREDYVASFDSFMSFLPGKLPVRLRLEMLRRENALEAMVEPLKGTPVSFAPEVAQRLVEQLLQVRRADGTLYLGAVVEPVLLQVVCDDLWGEMKRREERVITDEILTAFGTIEDSLSRFYENQVVVVSEAANYDALVICTWFGARLISPDRKREKVRRGTMETAGLPLEIADWFDLRHILRVADVTDGVTWYELTHERLIEPILQANARIEARVRAEQERQQQRRLAEEQRIFAPAAESPLVLPRGHVFVAYSRRDSDFVRRLVQDLRAEGVNLWVDQDEVTVGEQWWDSIVNAIRTTTAVILIATPDGRRSKWVERELRLADEQGIPVFPIWAAGDSYIESVPLGMASIQYVDMRSTDGYADGVKALLSALSNVTRYAPPPVDASPDFVPRNPYKGLHAFGEEDAADFFGREAFIAELIKTVGADRFLALVGASGSGKSSVLLAGLLPRLKAGALPGSEDWLYLSPFKPGTRPIENLARTLQPHLSNMSLDSIVTQLREPSQGSALVLHLSHPRLVLIVDQFEEVFALTTDEDERRQFIDLLTTLINRDERSRVMITLRADFYERTLKYPELARLISDQLNVVVQLTLAELEQAVTAPAALPDVRLTFDSGLVGELIYEVRDEPGALPLLQFTLDQLFERREGLRLTLEAYREIGGVRGALARYAERVYQDLSPAQQGLARSLFLRLVEVQLSEQSVTRRRALFSEFQFASQAETTAIRQVVDTFVTARLLSANRAGDVETIELSHEAVIQEWARLWEWVNQARADLLVQSRLSADAARWNESARSRDLLYRGNVLAEASAWSQRNTASTDEMAFIRASQAEEAFQRQRELRRVQRRVTLLLIAFGLGIALLVSGSLAFINGRNLERTRDALATEAAVAQTRLETIQAQNLTNQAHLISSANPDLALALALAAVKLAPDSLSGEAVLADIAYAPGTAARFEDGSPVYDVAVSPDGAFIASATLAGSIHVRPVNAADDGSLTLMPDRLVQAYAVAFSPDGTLAGAGCVGRGGCQTGMLVVGERASGSTVFSAQYGSVINTVDYSADGRRIAVGGCIFVEDDTCLNGRGFAAVYDIGTGALVFPPVETGETVNSVAFSPDGTQMMAAGCLERGEESCRRGLLTLFDTATGQPLLSVNGIEANVFDATFSPDGTAAALALGDNTVRLIDVASGQESRRFTGHTAPVWSAAFSPDGERLLSGSDDGTLILWDANTGEALRTFRGHSDSVYAGVFLPDGRAFVSASNDETVRRWTTTNGAIINQTVLMGSVDHVLALSSDTTRILGITAEGQLVVWDAASGEAVWQGETPFVPVSAALSPDGRWAVIGGFPDEDGEASLALIDLSAVREPELLAYTAPVYALSVSADGAAFVSVSEDETTLWDVERRSPRTSIPYGGLSVNFSDDDARIIVSSFAGLIVWDPIGTTPIFYEGEDSTPTFTVGLRRDEQYAYAMGDRAQLWDLASNTPYTLVGFDTSVNTASFSPDGTSVGAGGDDNRVLVWDTNTRTLLRQYGAHTHPIALLRYAPDGTRLISVDSSGEVITWAVHTLNELLAWVDRSRYVRPLSCDEQRTYGMVNSTAACSAE
jgi:WD40 repeat protein